MNLSDAQDLLEMVQRFVRGERTKGLAADIEGLLLESFQDEAWFDDASEALALFVPGGSAPYVDEDQLARDLIPLAEAVAAALGVSTDGP